MREGIQMSTVLTKKQMTEEDIILHLPLFLNGMLEKLQWKRRLQMVKSI